MSRRATGTDAHSHPGRTSPAAPATGTASAGRAGRTRRSTAGETHAASTPDSSVPSTRNGSACTQIATNTVAPVRTVGASSRPTSGPCSSVASSSVAQSATSDAVPRDVVVAGPGALTVGDAASRYRAGPHPAERPVDGRGGCGRPRSAPGPARDRSADQLSATRSSRTRSAVDTTSMSSVPSGPAARPSAGNA